MEDLKKQDAKLEERLRALEAEGLKREPGFKHKVVDEDKVSQPIPKTASSGFWSWFSGILGFTLFGTALYYLVFVHRFRRSFA